MIPDTAPEKPVQGKVIVVGNGRILTGGKVITPDMNPGDHDLFGRYVGTEIKIGDEGFPVMQETDILAVLQG